MHTRHFAAATLLLIGSSGAVAQPATDPGTKTPPATNTPAPAAPTRPAPPSPTPKPAADPAAFAELVEVNADGVAEVKEVCGGFRFVEGPLWRAAEGDLVFCDLGGDAMYRWKPGMEKAEEFWKPSDDAAGATLDNEGRLITAHFAGKVVRTEKDGSRTVIADKFEDKGLNSPNDVVVAKDGTIYFTDPGYGLSKERPSALGFYGVYKLAPTGELSLITRSLPAPNGIALSPDGKKLYVANSTPAKIYEWTLDDSGSASGEGKVLLSMQGRGIADGLKVDRRGNLYCTGPGGVWVLDSTGRELGVIQTPRGPSNCGWGGADGKTLYITCGQRVFSAQTKVGGELAGPKQN